MKFDKQFLENLINDKSNRKVTSIGVFNNDLYKLIHKQYKLEEITTHPDYPYQFLIECKNKYYLYLDCSVHSVSKGNSFDFIILSNINLMSAAYKTLCDFYEYSIVIIINGLKK